MSASLGDDISSLILTGWFDPRTLACVCNLDDDSWAPEDWRKENCAYIRLNWGDAPPSVPKGTGPNPHTLLNSGMFSFTPFEAQRKDILKFLYEDPRVKQYMFPDQDFLAGFFEGKWLSVGWQYNALKTMRYWHDYMWRDYEVKNLNYIVDKPWSKRVSSDGVASYLGRDGINHQWWCDEYFELGERKKENLEENFEDRLRSR